jgi:polyisoprenyl-phosphate glycosyltransferase
LSIDLSVVIPVFCEQENIEELHRRLVMAVEALGASAEFIFVDDASHDATPRMLADLRARDSRVKFARFSRNFGHQAAITAGLELASGAWVVVMDGDLQDPPEVIADLLMRQREGDWDVVYAVRERRPEHALFRFVNMAFYRMLRFTASTEIPADAGDFCLMRRSVVEELRRLPERSRFVRGLRAWVGFRQTEVAFTRPERNAGRPKYTWGVRSRLAFDALFGFSYLPLRISTLLGMLISVMGLGYALYILVGRMSGRFAVTPGWATVVISVLVLGGAQLLMLGILGEYLGRIYEEIKGRPQYIIQEKTGFGDDSAS